MQFKNHEAIYIWWNSTRKCPICDNHSGSFKFTCDTHSLEWDSIKTQWNSDWHRHYTDWVNSHIENIDGDMRPSTMPCSTCLGFIEISYNDYMCRKCRKMYELQTYKIT